MPVDDARRADVDGWRDEFAARELANATIARKLAAVSSFYGYWVQEGLIERNPARNAKRPRRAEGPTSITLTAEQAAQLLAYVDGLAAPPAGSSRRPDPRPAVIVRLLAETGMRVSELCGARFEDLAETGGHHVLTVTRKGRKRQQLPIAQTTRHRIDVYLAGRRDGWLVRAEREDKLRKPGGRLARQYVYDLLHRLGREAGPSGKPCGPGCTRTCYADRARRSLRPRACLRMRSSCCLATTTCVRRPGTFTTSASWMTTPCTKWPPRSRR